MLQQPSPATTEVTPSDADHPQPDCDREAAIRTANPLSAAADQIMVEPSNLENRAMSVPTGPHARESFRVKEREMHQLRRLLPVLCEMPYHAERREPGRRYLGCKWDQSVLALIDQPDYDDFDHDVDEDIVDGDVEKALQALIDRLSDCMTGRLSLLEHDAALAHEGRILAVLRNSLAGPVLTRLDDDLPPSDAERSDIPCAADDGLDEADVQRVRWVSTAETRATAEGAFSRWRYDESNPWIGGVGSMIDVPDGDRARALPPQAYDGLQKNLEAAIATACEAMIPISGDRVPLDPEHPEPLRCDVALVSAGRIHAVVKYSEAGPIVFRFRDLWPGMV